MIDCRDEAARDLPLVMETNELQGSRPSARRTALGGPLPQFPPKGGTTSDIAVLRACIFLQGVDRRMNLWSVVLLVPVVFALVYDLRMREVPDWISLLIVAWACLATATGLHKVTWLGLAAGAMLGLGLSAAVFYLGGLGGGDVKLLAAIGAAVGPWTLLSILAWMAVAGGVLALVAAARGKREFAYVPAIAVGVAVETFCPGGLARVLLR